MQGGQKMAITIKSCDFNEYIAGEVFRMLNSEKVSWGRKNGFHTLITDTEPKELLYPEGWYYAKGAFRNKHMSTTGMYGEIPMVKSDGTSWRDLAIYCTLYDEP